MLSHWTAKEAEAQRGDGTCSGSSRAEPDFCGPTSPGLSSLDHPVSWPGVSCSGPNPTACDRPSGEPLHLSETLQPGVGKVHCPEGL